MARTSIVLAASLTLATAAAEPPAGEPPAGEGAGTSKPALAGPSVAPAAPATGIVAFDFNGEVRRHDTTPEEAAVEKLNLDREIRARVRKVLNRRDAIIDEFVAGNIDLLTKFAAAAGGNDKLDQAMLGVEALQKLAPLREGGSLWEQVKAALPENAAEKFDAIMSEYWDAVVAEGKRKKNDKGKERSRFEIVAEERVTSFGREIERSFYRQQYSGNIIIGYLTQGLDLTEDQKIRLRQMSLEFSRDSETEPTEEEQQKLVLEMLSILTEAQRAKVIKRF